MKHLYYFETTTRIEDSCEIAAVLKKRLETSNNLAWKALSEIQNVSEALKCLHEEQPPNHKQELREKLMITLQEVTKQHKDLSEQCIRDLTTLSTSIVEDLNSIKKMMEDKGSFEFRQEFESIGKMVANEFGQPGTEFSEAEELQEIMERFSTELFAA